MIPEEAVAVPSPLFAAGTAFPSRRLDNESISDLKWRDNFVARFNVIDGIGIVFAPVPVVFLCDSADTSISRGAVDGSVVQDSVKDSEPLPWLMLSVRLVATSLSPASWLWFWERRGGGVVADEDDFAAQSLRLLRGGLNRFESWGPIWSNIRDPKFKILLEN